MQTPGITRSSLSPTSPPPSTLNPAAACVLQKDPGEYMAEMQRFLAAPSPALQRYTIDMTLRRYDSALRHLVEAGPQYFDQVGQGWGLQCQGLGLGSDGSLLSTR